MTTKTCKVCSEVKERYAFPKAGNTCKECWKIWQREYRTRQTDAYLQLHPKQPKPVLTHKTCTMCHKEHPIDNFNFASRIKNVRVPYCKPCHGKRAYACKLKRGDVDRENLKYRCNQFGITLEEFDKFHNEQNGLCALCRKPETHPVTKGGRLVGLPLIMTTIGATSEACFASDATLRYTSWNLTDSIGQSAQWSI
jgi:hypothetical protein